MSWKYLENLHNKRTWKRLPQDWVSSSMMVIKLFTSFWGFFLLGMSAMFLEWPTVQLILEVRGFLGYGTFRVKLRKVLSKMGWVRYLNFSLLSHKMTATAPSCVTWKTDHLFTHFSYGEEIHLSLKPQYTFLYIVDQNWATYLLLVQKNHDDCSWLRTIMAGTLGLSPLWPDKLNSVGMEKGKNSLRVGNSQYKGCPENIQP